MLKCKTLFNYNVIYNENPNKGWWFDTSEKIFCRQIFMKIGAHII